MFEDKKRLSSDFKIHEYSWNGRNEEISIILVSSSTRSDIPYSKTTAFGGVETGRQKAIETLAAQGTIRYIGLIPRFSAMSHRRAAKIIIVDELDVTCVIILITRQHKNISKTAEIPKKRSWKILH